MSSLPDITLNEELFITFQELIVQIAKGVADAQRSLDEQSLDIQKRIFTDPELKELRDAGVQATWYQIPEVTANLKISISSHKESEETGERKSAILFLSVYNATYKNSFEFDYQGTSEMNFKIVPIPPPIAATNTIVPDVIGDNRDEAEKEINEAMLILGTVTEEISQATLGVVIRQDPLANSSTQVGSSVDIVISKGL